LRVLAEVLLAGTDLWAVLLDGTFVSDGSLADVGVDVGIDDNVDVDAVVVVEKGRLA
jgi:hypothetical protein